ncbi:uncharacterized protein PV09_07932 [Verruconis gallopava]|uniref:Isochorismatase-like domain-containing protein n=1 Tax=Verruconis gallopava TaxID=253628 RepID=A0A0D2AN84_9PEZI|nr:uncharacterized protein PV09_07932 [Verruconis gallopava]KIW00579.1 hypothetical protein PV09_07932 [Verruconis gallopava]
MSTPAKQVTAARPYAWPHDLSLGKATTALVVIDMQRDFCAPDGYFAALGYDVAPIRAVIPRLRALLCAWRRAGWRVYHTREGHRPDLSTLPQREAFRSRVGGAEIGAEGPLGRFLVRGEPGHDIVSELYPVAGEAVIDKPMRSAFSWTDFDLLLRNAGVRNLVVSSLFAPRVGRLPRHGLRQQRLTSRHICGVTTDVCVLSTVKDAVERGYDVLLLEDGCAAARGDINDAVMHSVQLEGGIAGCVAKIDDVLQVLAQA